MPDLPGTTAMQIQINGMSYEHPRKLHTCCQFQIRESAYVDPLIRNLMTGVEHIRLPFASLQVTINMARYEVFLRIREVIMFG